MEEKHPLLSICIPTYNRAEILRDTLTQYTSCPEFDNDVELIISDNASTDHTGEVCLEFATKHDNVKYYRNKENVRDANFAIVLDYAQGDYIKLMNDNIYMPNEAIRQMKEQLRAYRKSRKPIFFVTGPVYERIGCNFMECNSLDAYVRHVSLFVTAISLFGAWREDWHEVKDKRRYKDLQLTQVDWTYQIVEKNGGCNLLYIVPFWYLSNGAENKFTQSYNFFKVHLENYVTIRDDYYRRGLISAETIRKDGHFFLKHYRKGICDILLLHKKGPFDTNGTTSILKRHFAADPYYYWYLVTLPLWYAGDLLRRTKNKLIKILCL